MQLQHLYLRNFRNYKEERVSFQPGINLILGGNAQGKTNLLEALFFLATGKSFRSNSLTDLIHHGESYFYLEAEFIRDGLSQQLKVFFDGKQKQIHYNRTPYSSFAHLLGLLPSVLFAPEDISLITGSPAERRKFLNLHIAQIDPVYVHHLVRYTHAMRQRNQLLKQGQEATLQIWEEIMAISASYLVCKRKEVLEELSSPLHQHMQMLSLNKDNLEVEYQPSFFKTSDLIQAFRIHFQKQRKREMLYGATLSGPHRDDFLVRIEKKEAKLFSSEGQKRCCISALRLAEWNRLKQQTHSNPLMCIDDFGVHLDAERSLLFQENLNYLGQVFLTSPHPLSITTHTLAIDAGQVLI